MSLSTLIFLLITSARMSSNSGVFRFNPHAFRGSSIFHFSAQDMAQCLRACYEQPKCAVAQYEDDYHGVCTTYMLYKKGNDGPLGAYVLSREETDPMCMTETATIDVTFQKIPRQENLTTVACNITQDVTMIQPYDRKNHYRFFVTNATWVADNWNATSITKPGENCTAVPVFHKAGKCSNPGIIFQTSYQKCTNAELLALRPDYRRLYFGEIYNVTGYYFYNAYAFADYCATQEGECLGKVEIQEYVDHKGDYFYDMPGSNPKNMESSDLGQIFFIAGMKRKVKAKKA